MRTHIRIAAIASLLTAAACQPSASPSAPQAPARATAEAQLPDVADHTARAAAAASPTTGISPVIGFSSLGATKGFLERTLGPSTYETPDEASYTVGACEVTLGLDERAAVTSVSVQLKSGCTFDASGISGHQRPLTIDGPVTFAEFERLFGRARYTSPCLRDCGNAYDPFIDAVVAGSRASGFVDVSAHAVFAAGPVLDASNVWEQKLRSSAGDAYVDRGRFNCDATFDAIPRAAFRDVMIESLVFGSDLGSSCE